MIATGRIAAPLLVAAAMASPSLALAEDTFQAETSLSYSRVRSDLSRSNTVNAQVIYFFDTLPVIKDYPLEQAQFVERIGSLSANYGQSSFGTDNVQKLSNGSSHGGTVLFTRPDSPLLLAASYDSASSGKSRTTFASLPGSFFDFESETRFYDLAIGAYLDRTTALALDWSRSRTRGRTTSNFAPFPGFHDTFTSVSLSGQHLAQLAGGDHVAFIASVSRNTHEQDGAGSEKNRTVFLQATYYPTKMLGLMLGVSSDRGDNRFSEGEFYLAAIRMFATPTLSLSLDFQKSHRKAPDATDFNFVTLKALVRF